MAFAKILVQEPGQLAKENYIYLQSTLLSSLSGAVFVFFLLFSLLEKKGVGWFFLFRRQGAVYIVDSERDAHAPSCLEALGRYRASLYIIDIYLVIIHGGVDRKDWRQKIRRHSVYKCNIGQHTVASRREKRAIATMMTSSGRHQPAYQKP